MSLSDMLHAAVLYYISSERSSFVS